MPTAVMKKRSSLFVITGTGTLRIGQALVELGPGDYATLPIGPDNAHQLLATGSEPLRYLCLSTLDSPEVVFYPDANKVGVITRQPGKGMEDPWMAKWFRADSDPAASVVMSWGSRRLDY